MIDLFERIYGPIDRKENKDGSVTIYQEIEENCECGINQGVEGPEGGDFLSPYLQEPDPDCLDCNGTGRVRYVERTEHPPLDDSPIPF